MKASLCILLALPQISGIAAHGQATSTAHLFVARPHVAPVEQNLAGKKETAQGSGTKVRAAIAEALTARREGDRDRALALLLQARKDVPNNVELLLDLAILEDEMQLYLDADDAIKACLRLAPQKPAALYAEARISRNRLQLPRAEKAMRAYLQLRPLDATAHFGLGLILRNQLEDDAAQAEFQRSLELQPLQAASSFELAELAAERGDKTAADCLYDAALRVDPNHAGALTGKAVLLFRRGDLDAADSLLRQAVATAPAYQTAHYYRGLLLEKLGRREESQRELALAAQLQALTDKVRGYRIAEAP